MYGLKPHRKFRAARLPMMTPLQDELAGHIKNASLLLMAVAVLILLIACANLANLILARTADRQHELSIRSAVGASRPRLIQQVLTECLLLAVISAGLGLIVAIWATSLASKVQPAPLPSQTYTILDAESSRLWSGLAWSARSFRNVACAERWPNTLVRGPRVYRIARLADGAR